MTRKFKLTLTLIFFLFSNCLFAAGTQAEWIIAAQKFSFTRNQTGSVADGLAVTLPSLILEKLSSSMYRNPDLDEKTDRELYKLKQERNSLFLQLSGEVKKRDSLFLEKYSQSELNRKINDADKKIMEVKSKLDENLKAEQNLKDAAYNNEKYFTANQNQPGEKITLYKKDITALFTPSAFALEQGLKSPAFEKDLVNAKINCLITGKITAYDEYLMLTVESYLYPGARLTSTITEIGTVDDADFIASNIVRQLAPVITNSMPVTLKISVTQPSEQSGFKTYIDDILYNSIEEEFIIDSGIHHIQFIADGYKSAGTNYYFEGNKYYDIKVSLDQLQSNTVYLLSNPFIEGDFLINGKPAEKLSDNSAKITINGNAILGQFITQENLSAFLYVPQHKLYDGVLYTAKVKPLDHSEYIEKYRRRMYLSYSVLVTSLVPTIATKGRLKSFVDLFNDTERIKLLNEEGELDKRFKEAKIWNTAAIACTGVSIAAGAWFVFELYRYFNAANSVLPANTKIDFNYEEPQEKAEPESTNTEPELAVPEPVEGQ